MKTRQNFAIGKTLVWSEHVRSTPLAISLRVKYELGIHFNQIHLIQIKFDLFKEIAMQGACFTLSVKII